MGALFGSRGRRLASVMTTPILVAALLGLISVESRSQAEVAFGSVCPVVGLGGSTVGDPGGGSAPATTLSYPFGLAVDASSGDVYVSERNFDVSTYDHAAGQARIRRINPGGPPTIDDVAFTPPGRRPGKMALSPDGSTLYVATGDFSFDPINRVYALDLTAQPPTFTLVAGGGATPPSPAGVTATDAQLGTVTDLEFSPLTGTLHISAGNLILELVGTTLRTVVGGGADNSTNGINSLLTALQGPLTMVFEPGGELVVGTFRRIRIVTPAGGANPYADGTIATLGGTNTPAGETPSGDGGPASAATFGEIVAMSGDTLGNLYVVAERAHTVRRIEAGTSTVTTLASGDAVPSSDAGIMGFADATGIAARFAYTTDVAVLGDDLIVADSWNNRLRHLADVAAVSEAVVTTYAGDGPDAVGDATGAALTHTTGFVSGLATAADGSVYLADNAAHRVWRRGPDGAMSPVVGTGRSRHSSAAVPTGPATATPLAVLRDVELSVDGATLYILERGRVLQVNLSTGTLSVLAGNGVVGAGSELDNSDPLAAQLDSSTGGKLAVTADEVWVTGSSGSVRRIDLSTGEVNTPVTGFGTGASITSLATDDAGNLFFSVQTAPQIVMRENGTGTTTTILGDGIAGLTPDGVLASASRTQSPRGLAWRNGRLVFANAGTMIRAIDAGPGTGAARWANGIVTTVAGSTDGSPLGGPSDWGDGADISSTPDAVRLNVVVDAEFDVDGRLFIADESGMSNTASTSALNEGPQTVRVITDRGCAEATLTGPATAEPAGQGGIDLSTLPVAQIPFDLSAIASMPLRAVPLRAVGTRSSPLRAVPLRAVPLRAVSLADTPLRAVTLSSLVLDPTLYPGGWAQRLEGTPFEGVPPQNVRLEQLLDDPATGPDETSGALRDSPEITLESVDLSTSPLRAVSIASLALGSTPLRAVPLNETLVEPDATDQDRFDAWCAFLSDPSNPAVSGLGLDCNEFGPDAPLMALEVRSVPLRAVPLRAVPLRAVDLSSSPLRAVPLRAVGLEPNPLRAVPLRAVPLRAVVEASARLGAVPLRAVPLRAVDLNASPLRAVQLSLLGNDVSLVATCFPSCATLGDAADSDAILSTATIAHLIPALSAPLGAGAAPTLGDLRFYPEDDPNGFFGGDGETDEVMLGDVNQALPLDPFISLADLLLGFVPAPDLPWEDVDLGAAGIAQVAPGSSATFDFSFRLFPSQTNPVPVAVTLPPGWRFTQTSSAQVTPDGGAASGISPLPTPTLSTDPLSGVQTVSYELSGLAAPSTVELGIDATPGMQTGIVSAQATVGPVSGGGATSTVASNPVEVTDGDGVNDTFDDATLIQPDRLYFGYLNESGNYGDTDYYAVPADGAGTLTDISLSHLGADADLVVYELDPSGIDLRSSVSRLRQQSKPLEMVNPQVDVAGEPLEPELLNDVAVLPDKTLAGTSARSGTANESIELINHKDSASPGGTDLTYVIAVTTYGDVSSPDPYMLRVRQLVPPGAQVCSATGPDPIALPDIPGGFVPSTGPSAIPDGTETLVLVNRERLARAYGTSAADALEAQLDTFAARSDVNGLLIPVDADATVGDAYGSWDSSPCGLGRPNVVVREINDLVDSLLAASSSSARAGVENVVVIGGDEQIPMARLLDNTKISNELEYGAELRRAGGSSTPQTVALAAKSLMSDDPYASLRPLLFEPDVIYPPTWSIGRLVETPTEIGGQLDAFATAGGRLAPDSALVTGYDFLSDGSDAVAEALGQTVSVDSSLVSGTWTAQDLDYKLIQPTDAPDLTSLNAHFDHFQLLPAAGDNNPNEPLYDTSDVAAQAEKLAGRILFSMGCHSGTSAPDFYLGSSGGDALDWPQAFAQQKAIWVANTGFGYGDTAAVAYSEKLMARFAAALRNGERAGEALRKAKKKYVEEGLSNSYDAKVLSQTVFYGLPMFRVGPGEPPVPTPSFVTPAPDPAAGGLLSVTRTVTPDLRSSPIQTDGSRYIYGYDANESVEALREKVQIADGRPIQPRVDTDVTASGLEARGSIVTAMEMTEELIDVSVVQPTVDTSRNAPGAISTDMVYPSAFSNVTNTTGPGARSNLLLVPGQFIADDDPATPANHGTQRRFTSMTATVYYAPPSATDDLAPTISATAGMGSAGVTFTADVADTDRDANPGQVRRVVALYRDGSTWRSAELVETSPGSGTFVGGGPAASAIVDYLIQAVDAAGNVGVSSNKARMFKSETAPVGGGGSNAAPTVVAGTAPTPGPYDPVAVSATFSDADSASWSATVNSGNGSTVVATVGAGTVSATLDPYQAPGTYTVTFSVCDDAGACGTATMTVAVSGGAVAPLAECSVLAFGGAITWWGTSNAGAGPASLPTGALNKFEPPPESRGQPTSIAAGTTTAVLGTQANPAAPLRWQLGGSAASAMSARGCN